MKRGSSVLPPPSDAAKRHAHTKTRGEHAPDTAGSSPFPAATSLFSPDVSTKMASDLLIRLSEATQKVQVHPGSRAEAEPPPRGGQQDEPGLALSPDGPGASPEPPSLTHTPDGNAAADTLASDLLRKLAERQEVNCVSVKEEEEPMEVDAMAASDLVRDRPAAAESDGVRLFAVKTEASGANVAERRLLGLKTEDGLFPGGVRSGPQTGDGGFLSGVKTEDPFPAGVQGLPGDPVFPRTKTEEQLLFGAKMEDQCLRAILWQDMSVNLASTLLHQLSERVSKSSSQLVGRSTPPTRSSPGLKVNVDPLRSSTVLNSQEPAYETQTSLSRDPNTGGSYFYRCHVCGFETEGRGLFQGHMTEHRQWERGSFSLRCCACDHSTNREAEMRAHADTHVRGDPGCPVAPPAASGSAPAVATATQPEKSTSEHRCRICQRSFPGQQELLVHFQGHRQGNQYRCDRCGHLTRTANKLVEHVRVHTGERPFTCDLCPYSAKRRDSLRLHCKVKHAAHGGGGGGAADAPGDVHTHRSYAHGDNQRSNKHVQRLHAAAPPLPLLHPSLSERAGWRDLSPLLPITTLLSLKPHAPPASPASPASSSSSSKHSFLGYLGLTTSL